MVQVSDRCVELHEKTSIASQISNERIAFVQYGDFFVDAMRLGNGGPETYFAQRYSVGMVERLTRKYAGVMVVCLNSNAYERVLPSGVRCIGMPNHALRQAERRQLLGLLQSWIPTTVIVMTPLGYLIRHCIKANWRVLPILADSFCDTALRRKLRYWRLARLFNHPSIGLIGNHQLPACRDLCRIGVNPDKIVPWDFPGESTPLDNPTKTQISQPGQLSVMFAGSVTEGKGVGDLIDAVALLKRSNTNVKVTIAGKGEIQYFRDRAMESGVADRVNFIGLIPNWQVVPLMNEHDVVVIPSRHRSPEGLPFTIFEALTSRSPLIVSDHPMFVQRLGDGASALVFPQAKPVALANCLKRLMTDNALYARLSRNSAEVWERLQIPVRWGELLEKWLAGGSENKNWLHATLSLDTSTSNFRGVPSKPI